MFLATNQPLGGAYVPTAPEVAHALSRVPRWNGQTLVPWSVLHHSLLVASLLTDRAEKELAGLWHDAVEVAVGDMSAAYKLPSQKNLEHDLTQWVYGKILRLPAPGETVREALKAADLTAALAEARTLLHPDRALEVWISTEDDQDPYGPEMHGTVCRLWELVQAPVPRLVDLFVETTDRLLLTKELQALHRRIN